MTPKEKDIIATAIHMLQCNTVAIRVGVVSHRMDMVVDAVNDMDKTILELGTELFPPAGTSNQVSKS